MTRVLRYLQGVWREAAAHGSRRLAGRLLRVPGRTHVLGWLAVSAVRRLPHTSALEKRGAAGLVKLLDSNDETAALLTQTQTETFTPAALVRAVGSDDLRSAGARVLILHPSRDEVAQLVYQVVGLSGPDVPSAQRETLLISLSRVAGSLTSAQARTVLRRCLQLGAQPVDPYEVPGAGQLARTASVAVLEAHPELDEVALQRAQPPAWSDLETLATALVQRSVGRAAAIQAVLDAWRPTADEALKFATLADTRRASLIEARVGARVERFPAVRDYCRRALRIGSTPLAVFVTILLAWRWRWTDPPLERSFGLATGAMAVVAAVHVVSAQLAAGRLRGVLARFGTASGSLSMAYWSAGCLGALALISPSSERLQDAIGWGAAASAAIFLVAVAIAAHGLVRLTDPGIAVQRFVANRRRAIRKSGLDLGRAQRRALESRDQLARVPFVALQSSLSVVSRGSTIRAPSRGFLTSSTGALGKLGDHPVWQDGQLKLALLERQGTIVSRGTPIGIVIPDGSSSVSKRDLRVIRQALDISDSRKVEETAEAAALLTEVAASLAGAGDSGGGQRAVESLVALLESHLASARIARGVVPEGELVPVVPAVRATVEAAIERLQRAGRAEAELLLDILDEVLTATSRPEAAVGMVNSAARRLNGLISDWHYVDILRRCVLAAMANDDSVSLSLVLDDIEKSMLSEEGEPRGPVVDLSSELVAVVCWRSYGLASSAWDWWWKATQTLDGKSARFLGAARIGAAALEAGVVSLALRVVLELRGSVSDLDAGREVLLRESVLVREKALSEVNGGYLGPSPLDALERFGDLMVAAGASMGD